MTSFKSTSVDFVSSRSACKSTRKFSPVLRFHKHRLAFFLFFLLFSTSVSLASFLATDSGLLYFRRPDRPGCSTDLYWLSRFSGSRIPHLEDATIACHLCLIVDCI